MDQKAVALVLGIVVIGGIFAYLQKADYDNIASENSSLTSQIQSLQTNISQLQSQVSSLQSQQAHTPPILLRTFGTALASYIERPDGLTYLRLTESGGQSGAEAAMATMEFNASIAGNSIEWSAVANSYAADNNHTTWPMVLENAPGGTDSIEFEDARGVQVVAVQVNGSFANAIVHWNPLVTNTFKIVIAKPGQQVDFYINGVLVKSLNVFVPRVNFLLAAGEVKGDGFFVGEVATLDIYGGLIPGS